MPDRILDPYQQLKQYIEGKHLFPQCPQLFLKYRILIEPFRTRPAVLQRTDTVL